MQLHAGYYFIASLAAIQEGGKGLLSRNLHEDRSLLPKPITLQPNESPGYQWKLEPSGGPDNYVLFNNGAPTCAIQNLLVAPLLNIPLAEKWFIRPQPQFGNDIYTIETQHRDEGWILPDLAPYTKMSVRPLIVGPSYPPFYPPNELFKFMPAGEEDL